MSADPALTVAAPALARALTPEEVRDRLAAGDSLLPAEEAAQLLGFTTRHVWRLWREGKLEGVKAGKYVRIWESAVYARLASGSVPAPRARSGGAEQVASVPVAELARSAAPAAAGNGRRRF